MDRSSQISQYALQLTRMSADGDWRALRKLDSEIATLLQRFARVTLSENERRALGELRRAHDEAFARCEQSATALKARLADMRANRDGWIAYAIANELQEDSA